MSFRIKNFHGAAFTVCRRQFQYAGEAAGSVFVQTSVGTDRHPLHERLNRRLLPALILELCLSHLTVHQCRRREIVKTMIGRLTTCRIAAILVLYLAAYKRSVRHADF